jgi:hypothetical protein
MKTLKITTYWSTEQAEDIVAMHQEIASDPQKMEESDEFNDELPF